MIFEYKRGKKHRAWGWGVFLLLVAALVIASQFGGFPDLGFWSIAIAILAAAFFVQCIADASFASLPIPIAALYYIFQRPLELPVLNFWPLVLITLLVTAGLHVIIPQKKFKFKYSSGKKNKNKNDIDVVYIDDDGDVTSQKINTDEGQFEEGGGDNNPRISVKFGGGSRYLHADALETVELDCSFGGLEVYFDHVTLSPDGAEAFLDCKFGSIEMYIPRHWHVIDNTSSSLGSIEYSGRTIPTENPPVLKVTGSVSCGSIEIRRIKEK